MSFGTSKSDRINNKDASSSFNISVANHVNSGRETEVEVRKGVQTEHFPYRREPKASSDKDEYWPSLMVSALRESDPMQHFAFVVERSTTDQLGGAWRDIHKLSVFGSQLLAMKKSFQKIRMSKWSSDGIL